MIDIYHSRRGKFKLCRYYVRDERDSIGDLTKYVLMNQATGVFYAQEISARTLQAGQLANAIMFDNSTVNIVTNDDVDGIKNGCVVMYLGHAWLVVNVQQEVHNQESEFGGDHRTTYISLKR